MHLITNNGKGSFTLFLLEHEVIANSVATQPLNWVKLTFDSLICMMILLINKV